MSTRFTELMAEIGLDKGDPLDPEEPMSPEYFSMRCLLEFITALPNKHYAWGTGEHSNDMQLSLPACEVWTNYRNEFFALHALLK